jgi:hypothetical protein
VNWKDVIFKDMSMRQKANISVTGGGNRVKYYCRCRFKHEQRMLNTKKMYSWNNTINIMKTTRSEQHRYMLTSSTTIRWT